jgi:uncharacterized membrane protein YeaQ/YmgE (transglycosylase-associated protein family)
VSLIVTLIVGLIVGVIARFIFPGPQPMGWIMTILLGIGGALVAGWGGQLLGLYSAGQPAGIVGSVVGALVLLFAFSKLKAKQ